MTYNVTQCVCNTALSAVLYIACTNTPTNATNPQSALQRDSAVIWPHACYQHRVRLCLKQ